jgi:hypothetical protein
MQGVQTFIGNGFHRGRVTPGDTIEHQGRTYTVSSDLTPWLRGVRPRTTPAGNRSATDGVVRVRVTSRPSTVRLAVDQADSRAQGLGTVGGVRIAFPIARQHLLVGHSVHRLPPSADRPRVA